MDVERFFNQKNNLQLSDLIDSLVSEIIDTFIEERYTQTDKVSLTPKNEEEN